MNDTQRWHTTQARLGILEWLRPGEYERAEQVLDDLRTLGIGRLRTGLSWADWFRPEGPAWFDWLIPKVANTAELLPSLTYTPPSLGIEPKTSSPPRNAKDYADFIDQMISRYGRHFEWMELWNEPNNLNDWDWRLDPDWQIFSRMIGMAAYWARKRGKKTLLGGMCPTDPNWLDRIGQNGVLTYIDAIGLHGFPGTWEFEQESWAHKVDKVRAVLQRHQVDPEIWLTEVGYSTWRHDEIMQVKVLLDVLEAPVDRIYWYTGYDLHPYESHQDGFHEDERHYHFGLKKANGTPKLVYRIWQDAGLAGLHTFAQSIFHSGAGLTRTPPAPLPGKGAKVIPARRTRKPVLITGGAGFIGTNLAQRLLDNGKDVLIFDNLGRPGVERNLEWLCARYGSKVQLEIADVRDSHLLQNAVFRAERIFHFAAQVAVTTSIDDPRQDFDINARGTLNLLETLRSMPAPPPLLFTSTNKVYGELEDLPLQQSATHYQPADSRQQTGVNESQRLDFHSPYGCSKGAAEQYVLDYARTYGIPATVFRMSCIYGPHQFGTEDQGWVAHFLIRALQGKPLTLYGDGCQVRDILFVEDLVNAMLLTCRHMPQLSGHAFNIGGGPRNSISLLEILPRIEALTGQRCHYSLSQWRRGDQKYYVSDTRAFGHITGWQPQTTIDSGLRQLHGWIRQHVAPAAELPSPLPTLVVPNASVR